MNQKVVPANNKNAEIDGKDEPTNQNKDVEEAGKLVAACSLQQPVEAPPSQEELDRQANELVGNFLLDLYSSFEAEELVRKQQPDNSRDKNSVQDWTVVRHKKKIDKNGNIWYDSESSEDSECDDDLDIDDLPAGSFKRIPLAHKKKSSEAPEAQRAGAQGSKMASSSSVDRSSVDRSSVDQQQYQSFGPSIFGFEDFRMFGGI